MKLFFYTAISILLYQTLYSQSPIQWQKSFGGSDDDGAFSMQQTFDGGYILAGYSRSSDGDVTGNHGIWDCWVVKLDTNGDLVWQKSLGGSDVDYAYSIQQTLDGGYIMAGLAASIDGDVTGNHGIVDYWVVKLNSNGDLVWQKTLGGSHSDAAFSIQQIDDGGYIVAGTSTSTDGDVTVNYGGKDYWIVKLDISGNLVWQKSLGGSENEQVRSIRQTNDGGYIVAGNSESIDGDVTGNHGGRDYWIVKLSASGNLVWQKSLGGSDDDLARAIQQTDDGGYIIAGISYSIDGDITNNLGSADYWIVKLDTSGNLVWQKSFGGSERDAAFSIQQTIDTGYIVSGISQSTDGDVTGNQGDYDFWIIKLDMNGILLWQESLGGSAEDGTFSIQQTDEGGYIVAGYTESNDGDITENNGMEDLWIVKLDATVGVAENMVNTTITIYPNPSMKIIHLKAEESLQKVTVFDVLGNICFTDYFSGESSANIEVGQLSSGVYILDIEGSKGKTSQFKIIKN